MREKINDVREKGRIVGAIFLDKGLDLTPK